MIFPRIDSFVVRVAFALALIKGAMISLMAVPSHLSHDNEGDTVYFRDASNLMHGVFGFGGLSRGSEAGHENYNADLAADEMARRGELWIDLITRMERDFHQDGLFLHKIPVNGGADDDLFVITDYSHGLYAYHMHHRAGRWAGHGLEQRITYAGLLYQVRPGVFLLENRFDNGEFFHDANREKMDKKSMAHGMAALQGHVYAWVRWAKPEGKEDMGLLTEDRLKNWMVYGPKDMVTVFARPTAQVLLDAWDKNIGIYNFDDNPVWDLESLGALLRGTKNVYETLYMFGDDADRDLAALIATQAARILSETLSLSKEWGVPSLIDFTPAGPVPASSEVDTEALWTFVNHIGSGFALFSEGEGMSNFLSDGPLGKPAAAFGNDVAIWLDFTIRDGLSNGYLAETISYKDGSVISDHNKIAGMGMFLVAGSNNYRRGDLFERASDWDDVDEETIKRSQQLYNTLKAHSQKLEGIAFNWL